MAYDLKKEEDVKQYLENLGIEYRFGCFKEKKPQVCHLLADYMEAIKKDFEKAGKVYKSNCLDYSFGKSCLKAGNYALLGRGKPGPDIPEAYKLFETGCDLDEPGSCLHAGLLLVAPSPTMNIVRDVPKGYNLLKKSCDLKDDKACHYLSGMYMSGVPKNVADYSPHNKDKNKKIDYIIKVDFKQAFDFAYKSCEMGNIFACANVGIIGGSGFDDPTLFTDQVERKVATPFGDPSDVIIEGYIGDVPCALLARHGRKHQYQPSDINYRANIWALKQLGCTNILATTATGSLVENYKPGDLVVLDDFIDRTWGRPCTFYDRNTAGPKGVCHLPMRPAFCERSRAALVRAASSRGYEHHDRGTAVVIQGPRFSSRAESLMHRQWGGHLVNMTTVPEVVLAKEAGLSYAAVAVVTDYDCWRDNETSVSVSEVLAMFAKNVKKAADVILDAVGYLAADTDLSYIQHHKDLVSSAVMLKE